MTLLLLYQNIIFSQDICYPDSIQCFILKKYEHTSLLIEKKWESDFDILVNQTPLLFDINGDCVSEIVVSRNLNNSREILFIDSRNGNILHQILTPSFLNIPSGFCIADLDNDNNPEIIIAADGNWNNLNTRGKLVCLNLDNSIKWISDERFDTYINSSIFGNPGTADFNLDGFPEIYMNNKIFNGQTGVKLIDGGSFNGLGIGRNNSAISIAGHLDSDLNDLELAAGFTIYKVKINNINGISSNLLIPFNVQIGNQLRDGFTSFGDINNDGQLDVIVSSPGYNNFKTIIYTYTFYNNSVELLATAEPNSVTSDEYIGCASVGNVNNLSYCSILFTRPYKLYSYHYDGTVNLKQDWSINTSDESGVTGLTIFDLNNNGLQDIVYRDETDLNIINCINQVPNIVAKIICSSPTARENPIIGDIDGKGESKICVVCSDQNSSIRNKLTVFGSPDTLPGWAPARGIWNQYNYHVLNINDDGTVPQYMHNNATYKNGKYNNFMVQESLLDSLGRYPQKATSLTGKINCVNYNTTTKQYEVNFDLNNRTDASLYAKNNLPVSFYNGNPESGGELIGKYYTTDTIFSGSTLSNLAYTFTVDSISHLFLVVNTERDSLGSFKEHHFLQLECDYTDNFYQFTLPPITKTTVAVCNGENYDFYNDTISTEGIYYHALQNINGCDSVILELDLRIEDTISIITNLSTCDTYTWNGNVYTQSGIYLDSKTTAAGCDSIATLNLTINKSSNIITTATTCDTFLWLGTIYDETGIYTFATQTAAGCDSIMKLELTVIPPDSIMLPTQEICNGDSLLFLGTWYKIGTNATIKLRNQYQCDSFITFELRVIDTLKTNETLSICQGDSIRIFDEWQSGPGVFSKSYQSAKGCDSLSQVQLIVNSVFVNSNTQNICLGDSALIYNEWKKVAGIYSKKYQTVNGCDSIETFELIVEQLIVNSDSILICEGDSVFVNGQSYRDEGNYQTILSSTEGCDTIYNFSLKYSPLLTRTENYSICEDDSVFINGNWLVPELVDGQAQVYVYEVREDNCKTEVTANFIINYSQITNNKYILCPEDSILLNSTWVNSTTELTYTLQSAEGCDSIIQAKVTKLKWPEPPVIELDCEDNVYNASINADENWDVLWSDMTNASATVLKESPAWVKVSTDENCEKIFDINLESLPDLSQLPSFEDQNILEGNDINVKVDLPDAEWQVLWLPVSAIGCDTCFETTISVASNTTITLELKNLNGCTYIRTFDVIVEKEIFTIVIPNIINPTSTSGNNIWTVDFPEGYIVQEAKVYDRWGNVVYNIEGSNLISWDGKIDGCEVVPGVYVYFIRYLSPEGQMQIIKGDITVVR